MFEDLRKQAKLSRVQLAERTRRSVGYVLKAEQATFPSPPIALINYWVSEGEDANILTAAYYDTQRRKRETWLEVYKPVMEATTWVPFRLKWVKRQAKWEAQDYGAGAVGSFLEGEEVVYSNPTAYGLSVGLCIPAAVVYRNDKDLTKAGAIRDAMEDLVEFVNTGRYVAGTHFEQRIEEEESIMRIAKEEGWNRTEPLDHQQMAS